MKRLAEGLYQLRGFPPNAINIYVIEDILIDAGARFAQKRILRQLRGQTIRAHALTHAHPDHQGASHAVCEALGIPLWCGEADAEAMENPDLIIERLPHTWVNRNIGRFFMGPAHPVARRLRQGDEVGGFTVIETPGHCAGHISYWREADRVLVMGDVLSNMNIWTGIPGLYEPQRMFTIDPARNRQSARQLAELEPALICFGHGPPLRDTKRFVQYIKALPA